MGLKEIRTEIQTEIKKTEEKLAHLKQMEAIATGMTVGYPVNTKEVLQENLPKTIPYTGKIKRKLKYTKFSDIETKQIMNLWNQLKNISNMSQQTITSQIARTLRQPYKRVYNKVYWLKRTGYIAVPQEMLMGTAPNMIKGEKFAKKSFFYWREGQKQQLKQLIAQRKKPKEIAEIMGIGIKIVSNKINRMKAYGEIPRARPNQAVPRNPLLNLK